MKKIGILLITLSTLLSFAMLGELVGATGEELVKIQKINKQILSLDDDIDLSVIDMYEAGGWIYNIPLNQLEREVTYADEKIQVEGEIYVTDEEGVVNVSSEKLSGKSVAQVEMIGTDEKISKKIGRSTDIKIIEEMNITSIVNDMGGAQVSTKATRVGGLSNGQLPANGAYVHCNRFNGYLGNGRYYSNHTSAQALTNFFTSDCDFALGRNLSCLKDYTSNPYCSTANTTTAGRCSSLIGHKKTFHKHSGYFS